MFKKDKLIVIYHNSGVIENTLRVMTDFLNNNNNNKDRELFIK